MGWLDGLRYRLRQRLDPARAERELEEELRFHLDQETRANIERGLTPQQARRAAELSLGGLEQVKEECRESWGGQLADSVAQDSRVGARGLMRSPGFALAATLTLALGIGADTAIFSVVNGVLLEPLPYRDGDRLVTLSQRAPGAGIDALGFTFAEIHAYRRGVPGLEGVAEYHALWFTLLGGDAPERVRTGVVSATYFDLLGVEPILGRRFVPADEQPDAPAVLLLSHEYWQRRHGGDPGVVGRVFEMNDRPHTVVGVLPPLPGFPRVDDVYMPTTACPFRTANVRSGNAGVRMIPLLVARMREGAALPDVVEELNRVAAAEQRRVPDAYPPGGGIRVDAEPLRDALTDRARPWLVWLLATAGLVLLNACANVANVVLARLLRRERELAMRRALGATRRRLVRQLVTESALLALAGGAVGLALAFLTRGALVAWAAGFTPRAAEVGVDGRVLLFTLAVCTLTAAVLGALPAFPRRERLAEALSGARGAVVGGRRSLQRALIVAQVGASFVLLVAAALSARQLFALDRADPGYRNASVVAVDLDLDFARFGTRLEEVPAFFDRVLERVRDQEGVEAAAASLSAPLDERLASAPLETEGRPLPRGERERVAWRSVTPGYFETIGVPVVAGRGFLACDGASDVAIVNRALAGRHFPEGALGRRLSLDRGATWLKVIGVVGDVRQRLEAEAAPEIYLPLAASPTWQASLLVRTRLDPTAAEAGLRSAVWAVDPRQPVGDARTLAEVRQQRLAPRRLTALLMALLALLALAITATGIGGAIACAVAERRREIAVRMALGAAPARVLGMVLAEVLALVAAGLGVGLAGVLVLERLMVDRLALVARPDDPLLIGTAAALLAGVAVLATVLPARRAAATSPMTAIAAE